MRNLAGVEDADTYIRGELDEAGVDRVVHLERLNNSEVPTRITGKLGAFEFRRLWYYWSVRGHVPRAIAEELYADPVGKRDVRVDGHCGRPAPNGGVDCYHIDSQEGLNLFVATLRRHGLADAEGKRLDAAMAKERVAPAPVPRVTLGQRWRLKATGEVWRVDSVRADSVKVFNGVLWDVLHISQFLAGDAWELVDAPEPEVSGLDRRIGDLIVGVKPSAPDPVPADERWQPGAVWEYRACGLSTPVEVEGSRGTNRRIIRFLDADLEVGRESMTAENGWRYVGRSAPPGQQAPPHDIPAIVRALIQDWAGRWADSARWARDRQEPHAATEDEARHDALTELVSVYEETTADGIPIWALDAFKLEPEHGEVQVRVFAEAGEALLAALNGAVASAPEVQPPSSAGEVARVRAALEREAEAFERATDGAPQADGRALRRGAALVESERDAMLLLAALGFEPWEQTRVLFGCTSPLEKEDGSERRRGEEHRHEGPPR